MRDSDLPRARPYRENDERSPRPRRDRRGDDREPPAARRRGGNGPLILFIVLGGVFFAVLIVGGFAYFSYRAAWKARQVEAQAQAQQPRINLPIEDVEPKAIPALPPAPPSPAAALPSVALSNVRREKGFAGAEEIAVDYEFASGFPLATKDSLVVKGPMGEIRIAVGGNQRTGTIRFRLVGPVALGGPYEIWWERKTGVGLRANSSKISTSLTLD